MDPPRHQRAYIELLACAVGIYTVLGIPISMTAWLGSSVRKWARRYTVGAMLHSVL